MKKKLKIKNAENCRGCEICIFECQRQFRKVGLNDSLIRVTKSAEHKYGIVLDPRINALDVDKIHKCCPRNVYELTTEEQNEFGN